MKVGIVGCGAMGERWARVLLPLGHVLTFVDVDQARVLPLIQKVGLCGNGDRRNLDAVILAVPNKHLAPLAHEYLDEGCHVLVEKPGALSSKDLQGVIQHAERVGLAIRVNYLLRTHPAAIAIQEHINSRRFGDVLIVRGVYGHGGRPGYESEWRMRCDDAGGGVAVDLGVHLVNLVQTLFNESSLAGASIHRSFYWMNDSACEDNAFFHLTTGESGPVASFHVSATEWINQFELEVFCRRGKFRWSGLGGSYGSEELLVSEQKTDGVRPETLSDLCWSAVDVGMSALMVMWQEFEASCAVPTYEDARRAVETLRIVEAMAS